MNSLLNENEALKQQNQLLVEELRRYQTQYQNDQATIANLSRVCPLPFSPLWRCDIHSGRIIF